MRDPVRAEEVTTEGCRMQSLRIVWKRFRLRKVKAMTWLIAGKIRLSTWRLSDNLSGAEALTCSINTYTDQCHSPLLFSFLVFFCGKIHENVTHSKCAAKHGPCYCSTSACPLPPSTAIKRLGRLTMDLLSSKKAERVPPRVRSTMSPTLFGRLFRSWGLVGSPTQIVADEPMVSAGISVSYYADAIHLT